MSWTAPTDNTTPTGYKAQYRKKGDANWTAYTGTLGATDTTLTLSNLDAGATYQVQVQTVTADDNSPWSDIGEGTANRPPTASGASFSGGTQPMGGSFAWHEAAPLGNGAFFTDADGDTLTYTASAQHPALVGVSLTGTAGTNAVLTAALLNQGASKVTYTAADGYGGQVTRTATITITATTSRSIAEHSAGGTAVGDPVTGTPYNNVALSYTLTGNAKESDLFVIDSSTGQISVAPGAPLDYETDDEYRETETENGQVIAKFYRGKVNYTVDGHASAIDVILKVTDVSSGKPAAPTLTRTEFSEPTDPALDVAWTPADANGLTVTGYEARYRVKGATDWTLYTGALGPTATSLNLPGLTAGATYEVQVRAVATDGGGEDITLSVSPHSFEETNIWAPITVTATRQGTGGEVVVSLRTFGGTADDGTDGDYVAIQWPTVKIPDGSTSGTATVTFSGTNDTLVEGSESLIISGTAAGLTVGRAIVTIIDDELAGPVIMGDEIGPWSDIGEGKANSPPAMTGLPLDFTLLWYGIWQHTTSYNLLEKFPDADGDTLTYSTSSAYPGIIRSWIDTDDDGVWLRIRTLNPTDEYTTVTYDAQDAYGGHTSHTVRVLGTATRETAYANENLPLNWPVATIKGVPYDDGDPETDDTLTYTLSGDAFGSMFKHNAGTGRIVLNTDRNLDFETKDRYLAEVSWVVQGQTAGASYIIYVVDLEAGKPKKPTLTRTEYSEPTAPGLDVTWTKPRFQGGYAADDPSEMLVLAPHLVITGYEVQYRKKAAQGEDPAAWTLYKYDDPEDSNDPPAQISELPATPTSLTLPDLDEGATYEVQVRAIGGEEGPGPWSNSGEAAANTPPAASSVDFSDGEADVGVDVTWDESQLGSFFTDPDGDTLTYTAAAEKPALLGVSVTGTPGTNAVLTARPLHPSASTVNYTATDPYGGSFTRSATVTGAAGETRSIAENSAAGTLVGTPVTGTPYNGVALTYSLTGKAKDSGLFVIDSTTGQISVATGAVLDYEAYAQHRETETVDGQVIKFYRGQVTYTVGGGPAAIDVIIEVTDVEPGVPGAPTVTRTEYSEPSAPGLDVAWSAPVADGMTIVGYQLQYRKKGETAWTDYTGTVSTTDAALPDLEPGVTYETRVRAMAREDTDITLTVSPASFNEADATARTPITVTATRSGTAGELTIHLVPSRSDSTAASNTDYRIHGLDFTKHLYPTVTIADGASTGSTTIDFTSNQDELAEGSETIVLYGFFPDDSDAGLRMNNPVITIIDDEQPGPVITGELSKWSDTGEGTANTPPAASGVSFLGGTLAMGGSFAWHEAPPLGSGAFFTDADGDTLTYAAEAEHPALVGVSVTGTPGTNAVLTAALLNQGASQVTFTATDGYGGQVTRTADITITAKTSRSIVEGSPAGTAVGAPVTGTPYDDGDPETDDALTYTLTGKAKDSGLFVIDSSTGQISVAAGATIDYDTDDTHRETTTENGEVTAKFYRGKVSYTVGGHAAVIDVRILVTENASPVITDPGNKSYDQGEEITAFDITVTDADNDTVTMTVTGLPSGLAYSNGQVSGTVSQTAAAQDYTATITANDGTNADVTKDFTVTVTDTNFSPVITDPGDKSYAQGAAITAFAITVTDADNDTLTVTVTGLPDGLSYSSTTKQVSGTVAKDATAQDYTATISADDGTNTAVTQDFTVTVTDAEFAPVITHPGNKTYVQGEAITAFDIEVTDADGDTLTVTVTGLPSGLSYSNGQVSGTVSQTAAVKDHTATITANDGTNADVTETFTVAVTDVSFGPEITDPGAKTYEQGEAITAFAIEATDPDGDTLTVTVTGLPDGLSYSSTTKQVSGTVAKAATVQAYTATISADDGDSETANATQDFTVTVTDVSFAPEIADPGDKSYAQGETITAFAITVTDADGDDLTVTVTGLPTGLAYSNGQVSGTVAKDATVQDYTATITANDGTNPAVTQDFTVTVTDESFAPEITDPGDKTYGQGASITAFRHRDLGRRRRRPHRVGDRAAQRPLVRQRAGLRHGREGRHRPGLHRHHHRQGRRSRRRDGDVHGDGDGRGLCAGHHGPRQQVLRPG